MLFAAALAVSSILAATPAFAADPPAKGKKAPPSDPDAYARSLASDANVCGAICMDEMDIMLFGGMITVPFNRPSVEQCGIWMSGTQQERAAEMSSRRKDADDEAAKNRYSARERDELRKRKTEPLRSCEAEFKRRCEEAKKTIPVEARKKAVDNAKAEIGRIAAEARKNQIERYLNNVLSACPLAE